MYIIQENNNYTKYFYCLVFLFISCASIPKEKAMDYSLYIHSFTNNGEKQYDWVSNSFSQGVATYLKANENFKIYAFMETKRNILNESSPLVIAKYVNAAYVVTGSYTVLNEKIKINLEFFSKHSKNRAIRTYVIQGDLDNLFELQEEAGELIINNREEIQKEDLILKKTFIKSDKKLKEEKDSEENLKKEQEEMKKEVLKQQNKELEDLQERFPDGKKTICQDLSSCF